MLAKGDRVVMNDKYHVPEQYRGKEFIVTAGPQEVGGTMCVGFVDSTTKEDSRITKGFSVTELGLCLRQNILIPTG